MQAQQNQEDIGCNYADDSSQIAVKNQKVQRTEYMTASRGHLRPFEYGNEPLLRSGSIEPNNSNSDFKYAKFMTPNVTKIKSDIELEQQAGILQLKPDQITKLDFEPVLLKKSPLKQ